MAKKVRATVLDIARQSGVSRATVSLVLRGSDLIKPETAAKVRQAMQDVGYVYNRAAANLRMSKTNVVGMIISDLTNPFFSELAVGIEDRLFKLGFTPILANTNNDLARQNQVLRSMMENGAAGVVLSPARGTEAAHLNILPASLPTVVTMRRIEGCEMPYVGQDNRNGARKGVEHLISLGHRRIAFFGGDRAITTQQERYRGYCDALTGAGLPVREDLVFETEVSKDGGSSAMTRALDHPEGPTAASCFNDIIAIGAVRALAMRGLLAGRDFSIVGFDDLDEAKDNYPPLTTIDAGTLSLGARAAETLIGVINQTPGMNLSVTGTSKLIVRASCGARQREDKDTEARFHGGRQRPDAA